MRYFFQDFLRMTTYAFSNQIKMSTLYQLKDKMLNYVLVSKKNVFLQRENKVSMK